MGRINLDTGQQIWGPTSSETAFDYYDGPGSQLATWPMATSTAAHTEEYATATTIKMDKKNGRLVTVQ